MLALFLQGPRQWTQGQRLGSGGESRGGGQGKVWLALGMPLIRGVGGGGGESVGLDGGGGVGNGGCGGVVRWRIHSEIYTLPLLSLLHPHHHPRSIEWMHVTRPECHCLRRGVII